MATAVQLRFKELKLDINVLEKVPSSIEHDQQSELPVFLREPIRPSMEGEKLGALADGLSGVWHFFYCSPINRKGDLAPEIRGPAVFFQQTEASASAIDVLFISKSSQWKGQAIINNTHIYFMVTDIDKVETAFFCMNKPLKREDTVIAGVGAALERIKREQQLVRPVAGIICFGEKLMQSTPIRPDLNTVISRAIAGREISQDELAIVREHFCMTYSTLDDLQTHHPRLSSYIRENIKINKQPLSLTPWPGLYVQWY